VHIPQENFTLIPGLFSSDYIVYGDRYKCLEWKDPVDSNMMTTGLAV